MWCLQKNLFAHLEELLCEKLGKLAKRINLSCARYQGWYHRAKRITVLVFFFFFFF